MKAVTFSFDDGVLQDVRLIEMLNKYGLKATFNINSGKFGIKDTIVRNGRSVCHDRISECDICRAYVGKRADGVLVALTLADKEGKHLALSCASYAPLAVVIKKRPCLGVGYGKRKCRAKPYVFTVKRAWGKDSLYRLAYRTKRALL